MFSKVLLPETKHLLEKLRPDDLPEGFYLAEDTAVALYLGHRRSSDLDFFTAKEFEEKQWEQKLKNRLDFKLIKRDWQTLVGYIGGVKISLLGYHYAQIAPPELYRKIPLASLPDLAAMKLDTIIGRGTKRGFLDIYFLSQKYTLKGLFSLYQKKYANFE